MSDVKKFKQYFSRKPKEMEELLEYEKFYMMKNSSLQQETSAEQVKRVGKQIFGTDFLE